MKCTSSVAYCLVNMYACMYVCMYTFNVSNVRCILFMEHTVSSWKCTYMRALRNNVALVSPVQPEWYRERTGDGDYVKDCWVIM